MHVQNGGFFFHLRALSNSSIIELNARFSPGSFFCAISHRVDTVLPQGQLLDSWISWSPGFLHFSLRDFYHAQWHGCPGIIEISICPEAVSNVMRRRLL